MFQEILVANSSGRFIHLLVSMTLKRLPRERREDHGTTRNDLFDGVSCQTKMLPAPGGSEMVWLRARSASDAAAIESPRVAAAQGPGVCTLHLQPIGRSFSSPVTKEWWLNTVRY